MAKKRKRRGGRGKGRRTFAGHTYQCSGKYVRTGRGRKRGPRMYCHRTDLK